MNRIQAIDAQRAHLEQAITHLEAVLQERGGSHLLRLQLAFCKERLWELEKGIAAAQPLEMILDGE